MSRRGGTRWVALLRAINVGGRRVKMEELRGVFSTLGLDDVESLQASGNVIFTTGSEGEEALRRRLEAGLADALGYDVATFLRTASEVATIAGHEPFSPREMETAFAVNVAFLHAPPEADRAAVLRTQESATNRFHLAGREVYWWRSSRQDESDFSNTVLERTLGQPSTMRTLRTVHKLAERTRS